MTISMKSKEDRYPTRHKAAGGSGSVSPRLDPVIYTEPGAEGPLTQAQLDEYDRNGFLVFNSFFPQSEVDNFLNDLKDYDRDGELKQRPEVIVEPKADKIRSIFGIHEISERFRRLTEDERLQSIAYQLLGSEVYIHQSRINDKPGFSGTGFNWHSDFETWHSEDGMPAMRCFSMSILLTENNEFNGPLMLIPGSHRNFVATPGETPRDNWKESLKHQTLGVPDPEILHRLTEQNGIVAPKAAAGSVILFECNTLHASGNNLSPWPRRNLFFVYNSVENTLQAPYCVNEPRPEFVATRQGMPVQKPSEARRAA